MSAGEMRISEHSGHWSSSCDNNQRKSRRSFDPKLTAATVQLYTWSNQFLELQQARNAKGVEEDWRRRQQQQKKGSIEWRRPVGNLI